MSTPLLSYGIVNSVYFGVYGNTLKILEESREKRKSSYLNIYLAGCVGGAAQLIPVIPTDYIKVVLQSQIPRHKGGTGGYRYTACCECYTLKVKFELINFELLM